jgi:DNA-binding NarL/FixJ family response regulator
MIRVAIADDNAVLRLGIVSHLELCDDIEVVAEADDGVSALEMLERHEPDVLILDVRMPGMDGLEVLERMSQPVAVLMLTNSDDPAIVRTALSRGASGYLTQPQSDPSEIAHAVRRVARGETHLSSRAATQILSLLPEEIAPSPATEDAAVRFHLSSREIEVVELLAKGYSNSEICQKLYIAEKTVKNHLNRIFVKLNARNRAEAMAIWRGEREAGGRA